MYGFSPLSDYPIGDAPLGSINTAPTVALNTPTNTATGQSLTPTLAFTGTDTDGDAISYEIQVDTVNTFDSLLLSPSVVQSKSAVNSDSGTKDLSLNSTPTVGNLLVAVLSYSQYATSRTVTPPAGFTQAFTPVSGSANSSDTDSIGVWFKTVEAGDGTSYVFTINGASTDANSGGMYEIANADNTSPINNYATDVTTLGANFTTATTPSVVPSVIGCLPIAGITGDNRQTVYGSITSGWTTDIISEGTYHPSYAAHKNTLTTDTTTGINTTFTVSGSQPDAGGAMFTLLIAPRPAPLIDKFSDIDSGFADITNGADTDPFASGDQIGYTTSTLTASTTYYWRVQGKDPTGTNIYGGWSSTFSFTTTSGGGAVNASVTQTAGTLTLTGGTQAVATSNISAVTQSSASLVITPGTQAVASQVTTSVTQVAASLVITPGTQAVASVQIASITQTSATLTITPGTQAVASSQVASVTQTSANLVITPGTQAVGAGSIVSASVTQVAANLVITPGTQAVASAQIAALTQAAANLVITPGTQATATSNIVSITQVSANLVITGGIQSVSGTTPSSGSYFREVFLLNEGWFTRTGTADKKVVVLTDGSLVMKVRPRMYVRL